MTGAARRWGALAAALAAVAAPGIAAPKAILYICRAATVREVFSSDRPALRRVLAEGGAAALVTGPREALPLATLQAGRYVRAGQGTPVEPGPAGVAVIVEPEVRPEAGDRMLADLRREAPLAPVVALHPWPAPSPRGAARSLTLPSWAGISTIHGRLTSDTTRTPGVVSILDVAPTLAALCREQAPPRSAGHEIAGAPYSHGLRGGLPAHAAAVMRWQDATRVIALATNPTNYLIAFGSIALILAAALGLAAGRMRKGRARRRWQAALLLPLCAPVGAAVSAGRLPTTTEAYYVVAAAVAAGCWLFVMLAGRLLAEADAEVAPTRLLVGSAGLCAFIAADVARHGLALRLSPLSSFYLTGIRFYGLGNEYAALFLAAAAVAAGAAMERGGSARLSRGGAAGLGAWLTAAALVVGWPGLGANMGGLLTAIATLGALWLLIGHKAGIHRPIVHVALAAVVLVGAVLWHETHTAHSTHVGRFVQAAPGGAWRGMLATKAAINLRLLVAGPAWAVYAMTWLFVALLRGPLAATRSRLEERHPWLMAAVKASLIGGLAGAVLNDTGIVMLGLMAVVAVGAAVMLALEPRRLEVAG